MIFPKFKRKLVFYSRRSFVFLPSKIFFQKVRILHQCKVTQKKYPYFEWFNKVFPLRSHICSRMVETIANETSVVSPRASKLIGIWLIGCSAMVIGSVTLGGITRLTKSGLSMVNWHLFKEFPPKTHVDWEKEFKKYQQYPEFKQINKDMILEDFKWIWWMEYSHRMWGRALGMVYLLPAVIFWKRNWFTFTMKKRVSAFGCLILFEGLLGWYMVKSGLEENPESSGVARVSQYRLAAHLGTALVLYSLLLSSGLNYLLPLQSMPASSKMKNLCRMSHVAKSVIFLTAFSGAFVAGVEAGLIYNTFPKMADRWIPSDIFACSPKWENMTKNPATIQFIHRLLGETVFCMITSMWLYARKLPLAPRAKFALNCLLAVTVIQVTLGIMTLSLQIPKPLATSHQVGAITLLSMAIWVDHELKVLKKLPK